MDVAVAQTVADTLLERVATIAARQISAIHGVEDALKELQTRLQRLKGFLLHADTRGIRDSEGTLLKELRDVMYDVDDVVDTCMIDGGRLLKLELRVRSPFSSVSSCFRCLKYRHQIAADIQKIDDRIDKIIKDRGITAPVDKTKISESVRRESRNSTNRETAPKEANMNIVGPQIESNSQKLITDILENDEAKCAIFAITGMGGIGKTTLASKVYNDEKITSKFSKRIWLHISKNYSASDLLITRRIIRTLEGKVLEGDQESKAELEAKLDKVLEGPERLFLVLDDVWSADIWFKSLRGPMTRRRAECKILVTTRQENVARSLQARHCYPVAKMDNESCWNLLCKELYGDGDQNEEEIHELIGTGLEIVQKCDGLPLAVKAIAGVLRGKERDVNVWLRVLNSEMWSMREIDDEVPRALYLSYEDLSPELKQCFLYGCLMFSANREMNKIDIVRYWIDEGFITSGNGSPVDNQKIEDEAEGRYAELMERNLLQPHPMYMYTNNFMYTMHDLLKSLGRSLMEGEAICIRGGHERVPATSPTTKLRRLVMMPSAGETETCETLKIAHVQAEPKHLRALFVYGVFNAIEDSLFERLCHLRILVLRGSKIEKLSPSIGTLLHLRHLDLHRTNITQIPSSIGRLASLQTLSAAACPSLRQLPTTVTRLRNLRFLHVDNTPLTHVPKGIGQLKNLNSITGLVIGRSGELMSTEEEEKGCFRSKKEEKGCELGELQHLSGLRLLHLHMLHRSSDAVTGGSVLADKSFLRALVLSEVVCKGEEPTNLTKEQILATEDIYNALSPPPSLQELYIYSFPGEVLPGWLMSRSLGDSFPNMTILVIMNATSCMRLPPQLCQLPRLKNLRIRGADAISEIGTEFFANRPGDVPFPKLLFMQFEEMPNWEEWLSSSLQDDDDQVARYGSSNNRLLPNLRSLSIMNCPKLKALPDCLSLATSLKSLRIIKSSQLREIKNLPMLANILELVGCEMLERLSNLASLKRLRILDCPKLDVVENLDELQDLFIETSADDLPGWLSSTVKRLGPLFKKMEMRCNLKLLEACQMDGPNWHIIRQFPEVKIEDISSSGKYIRYSSDDPHSYWTNV